jgi:hypothetical protein
VEYIGAHEDGGRVVRAKDACAPESMPAIDSNQLAQLERSHPEGLTSAEILDLFARHGVPFSEASLRKYVQLGLLPRSVRIGRKGKHRGSQGMYPVGVVRQILRIKQMMAESYTIEQIQKEFLFIRSDIEQLEKLLGGIFKKLGSVIKERRAESTAQVVARDVGDARSISKDLLARLAAIETKLTSRTRMTTIAAS